MRGASHLIIGVGTALLVHRALPLGGDVVTVGLALGAAAIGSLLPDIDHDESKLRHMTGTARGSLGGCLASPLVALLGGHRALTHTLMAVALASLPALGLYFVAGPTAICKVALAFAVGYLSHVMADALTVSGVPLWWPVSERRFHLLPRGLRMRTGSLMEYAVIVVMGVMIGMIGLKI